MLEWGAVNARDELQAKDREDTGILPPNGNVEVDGKEMSLQRWLKSVYNWPSVQTYIFVIHKSTGENLDEIREAYMIEKGID